MFSSTQGRLYCHWPGSPDPVTDSNHYEWRRQCDFARRVAHGGGLVEYLEMCGERGSHLGPYEWEREDSGLWVVRQSAPLYYDTRAAHVYARLTGEQLIFWLRSYLCHAFYTVYYRCRTIGAAELSSMTSLFSCTLDGQGAEVVSLELEDCYVQSQPECEVITVKTTDMTIPAYPRELSARHVIYWEGDIDLTDCLPGYRALPITLTAPVVYLDIPRSFTQNMIIRAEIIQIDHDDAVDTPEDIPAGWQAEVISLPAHTYYWDDQGWRESRYYAAFDSAQGGESDRPLRTDYRLDGHLLEYEWEPRYTVYFTGGALCPPGHQILVHESRVMLTERISWAKSARSSLE